MDKIVLSGYYGFNNLGDEAILETMVKSFLETQNNLEITVLSAQPAQTEKKMGVKAVHRSQFFSVLKAIWRADMFISGGGSLLQDMTSRWSIRYYLAVIFCAVVFKKPVFLYAHGIGPVKGKLNRKLVKFILSRVDAITVRDKNSKIDLVSMGINKEKIFLTADPVVAMEMDSKKQGQTILKEILKRDWEKRPLIGLSLRTKDFSDFKRRQMLKNLIESLTVRYEVILLPFHLKEDKELSNWARENGIPALSELVGAQEMLSVVENLDALVGARLHSLIFAAVAHIPFVGISYDPKIESFLEIFELEPVCQVSSFSSEAVLKGLEKALCQEKNLSETRKKRMEEMKSRFEINTVIFKRLLEKGKNHDDRVC